MKAQTFGAMVAALRKEKGMTQQDLAGKMGVTDKAVSKWERNLSYPDTASLPKLAETLGVSVDELMQGQTAVRETASFSEATHLFPVILTGVALAMGVAVAVLTLLRKLDANSALGMLGLGLACLALRLLPQRDE